MNLQHSLHRCRIRTFSSVLAPHFVEVPVFATVSASGLVMPVGRNVEQVPRLQMYKNAPVVNLISLVFIF